MPSAMTNTLSVKSSVERVLATRSIAAPATRDIRKVALDGTTAFALDPVSAAERSSGQFAPREVTILFRHR